MSLIEGMSYGLPVIESNSGSVPNVVDEGKDGFLVKAGNIEELAEKIYLFSNNAELRQKMGENGRMHAIKVYNPSVFCNSLRHIYSDILGE